MPLTEQYDYRGVFSQDGRRLIRRFDGETLLIEPWGRDSLRVRAWRQPAMPEHDWALMPPVETDAQVCIADGQATLTNGRITARVSEAGRVTLLNDHGEVLLEEYVRNRQDIFADYCSALEIDAREFKSLPGAGWALSLRLESDPEERLYGMGQYQMALLNLKGCELELAQRNSQASVPFVVSSKGYGFLWNNPAVGRASFGRNVTTWTAEATDMLDYWVTSADTPAGILERYTDVTGHPPVMPDWALGLWQSKLRYQTQDELMATAREYRRRGLPLSVIVVDFFHWPHQGDWKFDSRYWPDPRGMIEELRAMGVELMVSVWPTVEKASDHFQTMLNRGLLMQVNRGVRVTMEFMGNTVHADMTNPATREYVWQQAEKNYYDQGVRLFWLDEAEPEFVRYDYDLYRFHLGQAAQVGNFFPRCYAQAFYEGLTSRGQSEIVSLVRCAWAGSQRYGALVWSGDIHSSFTALRRQFAAGLNMGMAGIPWWTTDIGGFHGGNIVDPAFRELLVRWFQFGTFCPVMRLHGMREPEQPPMGTNGGARCPSGASNELWSFGEEVYAILRRYLTLRERMRPYLRELMSQAHETGAPVIRPLFYEFSRDPRAWQVEDEMMLGSAVLVAPVMEAGCTRRAVYLPAGTAWIQADTGMPYEGGQIIQAEAPIESIPFFFRAGQETVFDWHDLEQA